MRVDDVEKAVAMCLDIMQHTSRRQGQRSLISMIGETLIAGDCEYDDDLILGEAHFASVLKFTSHKTMTRDFSTRSESGDPWKYLTDFDVHTTRRVCFVTPKGYLGLGSEYTMEGDVICLPQGSLTPYILRPEEEHYILIGQCYMSVSPGQEYLLDVADTFTRSNTLLEARRSLKSVDFVYIKLLVSEKVPCVDNRSSRLFGVHLTSRSAEQRQNCLAFTSSLSRSQTHTHTTQPSLNHHHPATLAAISSTTTNDNSSNMDLLAKK